VSSHSTRSIYSASAALLGAAALAAGCGDANSASDGKRCPAAQQAAAAEVARVAYNDGRLGGPAGLRKYFGPNVRFLDANGKLRPYGSFHGQARFDFERWMAHVEGTNHTVAERMDNARERVRAQDDCS
jgi:hypothetical protein